MFSTVATITGLIKFMSYGWHKGKQIQEVRNRLGAQRLPFLA